MTTLLPSHKIQPPAWMRNPNLIRILDTLNHDGINARMVGGCIRNHYYNKPVHDIDIACIFTPEHSTKLLSNSGIKIIPTGIQHGTITAHINGENFEITTLRQDVATDGRHAEVKFSTDWVQDAQRRDFTINALYADRDGSIYDPLGCGLNDVQNHIVRFIGNPEKRIQEDYLRILRFFRFYADYHDGEPHTESLAACAAFKDNINTLSDERIFDELQKTLMSNHADRAIAVMHTCELFNLSNDKSAKIKTLIHEQNQLNTPCFESRYFITQISTQYIKSKKILLFINQLNDFINNWNENIKLALNKYDRDVVIQGLLILKSQSINISDTLISEAINLKRPTLPINAQDIMQQFKIAEGIEVGTFLKQAEKAWIDSNFTLKYQNILKILMDSQR